MALVPQLEVSMIDDSQESVGLWASEALHALNPFAFLSILARWVLSGGPV